MWKFVVNSVQGSAHLVNGLPCQDAGEIVNVGSVVICALSDGAGSAPYSDVGSKIIVKEAIRFFGDLLQGNPEPEFLVSDFDHSDGFRLIEHIQTCLSAEASTRQASINDFAGTLLVAIIHDSHSCFYQIGDGVWCISRSGVVGAVTWPVQGEFAGQTVFATSRLSTQDIQCVSLSGPIEYIIGMTDGTERLALDMQARVPHRGFCDPMIKGLLSSTDQDKLKSGLKAFLSSEAVCNRTDDDKTLALIVHARSV